MKPSKPPPIDLADLLGDAPSAPAADTMTAEALADLLGITSRTVRDLAQRGLLIKSAPGAYSHRESVRTYCDHLREQAAGRGGSTSLAAERTRQAREAADGQALKNAATRRELVPARDVELEWSAILRDVRAALLALPSRVQQRVGTLTAHDVSEIDAEIRAALAETGRA